MFNVFAAMTMSATWIVAAVFEDHIEVGLLVYNTKHFLLPLVCFQQATILCLAASRI